MKIISCTQDDSADLGMLHVEGWRASYGGLVPQDFLNALDAGKMAGDWRAWFAAGTQASIARTEDGKPAGFIAYGRLKTPPPGMSPVRPLYTAEILAIYILPDYWQQGLGRALMREAALKLREQKHKSLCLWVLEGNKRASAFYKALGGERCGKKTVEIGGKQLPELAFGWRDTTSLSSG